MNLVDRHEYILAYLKKSEHISVIELCKDLNVSSVTIRKDLKQLEDSNLLFRTHGGATNKNPYIIDRNVLEKEKYYSKEKALISKQAVSYIEPHESIIIASGTTMHALADAMDPNMELNVITSSLQVSMKLNQFSSVEVLQLPGTLRKSSISISGYYAEQILGDYFCSKLFIGADGIDLIYGLSTTSGQEAKLNKAMIQSAQKVIVLADSSKFGRKSFGRICAIDEIDMIITDKGITSYYREEIEKIGVKLIIAE
jgi:DeoR family transcriptional regulator of aga operon